MRWAASDVSPSSHLAFHILNTCRFFVLCCVLGVWGFVALSCFCFQFCKCFRIPNSPRSLDLDDRQGLIASSAMQQKKKISASCRVQLSQVQAPTWSSLEHSIKEDANSGHVAVLQPVDAAGNVLTFFFFCSMLLG